MWSLEVTSDIHLANFYTFFLQQQEICSPALGVPAAPVEGRAFSVLGTLYPVAWLTGHFYKVEIYEQVLCSDLVAKWRAALCSRLKKIIGRFLKQLGKHCSCAKLRNSLGQKNKEPNPTYTYRVDFILLVSFHGVFIFIIEYCRFLH